MIHVTRLRFRGWRLWVSLALVTFALFVFFFAACGKGEAGPTEPPAAAPG